MGDSKEEKKEIAEILNRRTISELCGILQERKLATDGKKPVLVARLADDILAKGDKEDVLAKGDQMTGEVPADAEAAEQRMRDATEQYIAEHLKDKSKAEKQPLARKTKSADQASGKIDSGNKTRGAKADDQASNGNGKSRKVDENSDGAAKKRAKADDRAQLARKEKSRSRDRSRQDEGELHDDSQVESLRKLANDLCRSGLRETLKAIDSGLVRGDVRPDMMADLENKLSAAIDLIEAQRDSEATQHCRQVNADRNVGLPSATVEKEQRNTRRSQSNVDNTENMFENMQRFPFEAVIEGGIAIAEHIAEKVNQLAEPHTALCIFNWQGALYLQKSGRLAADMGIAVEMCRNKGMDIGIISTMPGSPALIQQSLMTLDPEYFNQNYFSSAAFQVNREGDNSEYPGQKRIDDVLGFYKIPEENQCVLFFDTVYWPIPSDRVTSIILDPETGITTSAVEKGFEKLGDKCFLSSNSLSTQRQTRTQRQKILHEIMSGNVPHRDEDISLPPLFWDYGPPPLARDSSTKDFAPPLPPMQRSWFAGRVCIFDFDGTLLLNSGTTWSLSEYSKTAIESCIMANMKIAIIYDLPSPPEQAAFNILETAFPLLFTKKFFQSPAFQSNIIDITFVLSSILDYFRADPKCSMMWDNQYSIEAEKLGIVHQFTAPDIGLVKSDYLNAWNKMNTSCKLGNIPGKCPSLKFSEGVIPPMCIEFTDGQACRLKCEYGYLPATGSTSIVCDQGNWTAKPLRCKLDPEVTIPEESTSVFKAENRGVMKQLMGEYPLDMVDKMPKDSLHAKFMPK